MRIERVLAPNPGPFTGPGTNTWVVGDEREVLVIDPGPVERSHEQAIVTTIGDRAATAVIVTHTHSDHAPLANPLARALGVTALGYAPGPEFEPDARLADGDEIPCAGAHLRVIHTPGHADDHLCFRLHDVVFTGDHVMGGSSVMVDDVASYLRSLDRLRRERPARLYPGHGEEIDSPTQVIDWYIAHRIERERQILAAVEGGAGTVGGVVETVYADVDHALYPLAQRNVVAHLRKLAVDAAVRLDGGEWDDTVESIRTTD